MHSHHFKLPTNSDNGVFRAKCLHCDVVKEWPVASKVNTYNPWIYNDSKIEKWLNDMAIDGMKYALMGKRGNLI